jgi:hypothetical protein
MGKRPKPSLNTIASSSNQLKTLRWGSLAERYGIGTDSSIVRPAFNGLIVRRGAGTSDVHCWVTKAETSIGTAHALARRREAGS